MTGLFPSLQKLEISNQTLDSNVSRGSADHKVKSKGESIMTIDLLSPFWGGLAVGIILLNIAGILKFAIVSTQKKAAEEHISNLISELYSLHKNYKDEIAKIKKRHNYELTNAIEVATEEYEKNINKLITYEFRHRDPLLKPTPGSIGDF
jgi:hypothetical protein